MISESQKEHNKKQDEFIDHLVHQNQEYSVFQISFRVKDIGYLSITEYFPEDFFWLHGFADAEDVFDAIDCNNDATDIVEGVGYYEALILLEYEERDFYWSHMTVTNFLPLEETLNPVEIEPDFDTDNELPF